MIKTWQKRQHFRTIVELSQYQSVLKYIGGIKNDNPTMKIFLSHDDEKVKDFCKYYHRFSKGTRLEFVNVAEKSKETFRATENQMDNKLFCISKSDREGLSQTIKNQGERVYANHSSIVGLGIGTMVENDQVKPCIILYSLDKDLIPFGEKQLPKYLERWPCNVQEDIVMFGSCYDCRKITLPNPGCCIGLPKKGIGSVGFLVKLKETESETAGFLTAAHVAAENWPDLYCTNSLLSVLGGNIKYEIVHPLLPHNSDYQVIGMVKESFCGNWGSEGTGIDAAFVQNYEPSKGGKIQFSNFAFKIKKKLFAQKRLMN